MIKFLQTPRLYVGFPRARSSVLSFSSFISVTFFPPLNISCIYLICWWYKVFFRHKDPSTLINIVNQELLLLQLGFVPISLLSILMSLSKFTLFYSQRKMIDLSRFNIIFDSISISRVQENKFLGITIHENVSWKPHITLLFVVRFLRS